jgi:hypothetical protein
MSAQTLSPADITALLANTRERGGHERFARKFIDSGEMYVQLNLHPQYAGKSESAVKQGFANAAKKIEGSNLKVVDAGEPMGLILVNVNVATAAVTDENDS